MTSTWNCNYQTYGRIEGGAPRGPCQIAGFAFGSNDVDSAYAMAGIAHDYVAARYGLNGANNLGGIGNNAINRTRTELQVHIDLSIGTGCPKAAWIASSGRLYFCVGIVVSDVVGHEYAHAVHYYAVTDMNGNAVGVQYSGESGTLDESGSDIAGEALQGFYNESLDWEHPSGTPWLFRRLSDPPSIPDYRYDMTGPFPNRKNHYNYYCGASDNGGVHHNGTVVSYACYLMTVGGEFNGCGFDSIGFEAVQQILYRAWAEYFTYTVTFAEAVNAFQQSCIDLYDATHPEYLATVTAALQAVEMDQPGRCSGIPEVAPACAMHGAGVVSHDTTVYLGQNTVVNGTGGLAEREVTFYLSAHPAVDTIWAPINIYREVMNRDTVELDGSLLANAWLADTLGVFDIIVDENSDGFFQPWADTILTVQVIEMPASLDLVTVQLNDHELRFHWKQISSSANYVLEHDDNFDFATPDTVVITSDTTATDSVNVLGSETGFYRVRVE
ncbi:M4 family metallopeptidase [bacterium]|nr:M4 family metallopeptidase [bacterium]